MSRRDLTQLHPTEVTFARRIRGVAGSGTIEGLVRIGRAILLVRFEPLREITPKELDALFNAVYERPMVRREVA